MRWVSFLIFVLFLCVAGATAFLETKTGVRWVQSTLFRALERLGVRVEVAEISGQLPEVMYLKGVKITKPDGQTVSVEQLDFELSLIRLLKREVFVRSLYARGIRVSGQTSGNSELPILVKVQSFRLEEIEGLDGVVLTGKFKAKKEAKLELNVAGPYNGQLTAVGTISSWSGVFSGRYAPWDFSGHVHRSKHRWLLEHVDATNGQLQLKGTGELDDEYNIQQAHVQLAMPSTKLFATADVTGSAVKGLWRLPEIPVEGSWEGTMSGRLLTGKTSAHGLWVREPFTATSNFTYRLGESLQLEQMEAQSVLGTVRGDLVLRPDRLWVGRVEFENLQLTTLRIPELSGIANGTASLAVDDFAVDAVGHEVFWRTAYAKEVVLNKHDRFHVVVKDGLWNELSVQAASADFGMTGPFELMLDGTLKEPLQLAASGELQTGQLKLSQLKGSVLNHAVALTSPAEFTWGHEGWALKPLACSVGAGTLSAEASSSQWTLHATQMPLDLFELTPWHLPVRGTADANVFFNQTQGNWNLAVHELQVSGRQRKAEATVAGTWANERVQTHAELTSNGHKLFTFDADVPMRFEHGVQFPQNKKAQAHLVTNGAIEDVLDFFDLGTHRFTGHWTGDLWLRGTLGSPRLEGVCEIEDGSYENYLTGTVLTRAQASIVPEHGRLHLRNLRAESGSGKLTGTGTLHLHEKFPFELHLDFTKVNIAQIDLVSATAEGHISIQGNVDGADARGRVHVLDAQFSIPEKIPTPLPELVVVYKHKEHPVSEPKAVPYPLRLHLDVQAPKGIFIAGRGLSSEWHGNFHVGGTFTSIAAKGSLGLLAGKFVFSSREFELTNGALSFSGHEYEMPNIDLSGKMAERNITITARLHGPLNAPKLTFQSTPPLPFGSILSYLLFGKDISEIDGFQAIQLASSVASIAGTSPDVLENTKKSLGIDRLRIVSKGNGDEGETVAVQVGKYVAKGVLVSFSQGADDSSTNVSIEVDLKHGFVFQAETEQQEEQGKFTLKWNTNY